MKERLSRFLSYMHKKVILPMKRKHKDPFYLARSNAIGIGLAFAPFPGQTPVVLALWLFLRRTKGRFSLPVSVAWTFISNVFTNLPLFYLYYKTGAFLTHTRQTMSYAELSSLFNDGLFNGLQDFITTTGYNIVLGSCCYMTAGAVFGYVLGRLTTK